MVDRKDRDVLARLEARDFADAGVRSFLDRLSVEAAEHRLGTPRVQVIYAQPAGYWSVGDGRPALASEDPAVMEAIGRCASSRVIGQLGPVSLSPRSIHPTECGWCEYPIEQLLAACDWATWFSREVIAELRIWDGSGGSSYIREARADEFEQPEWRRFWSLPANERRRRVQQAVAA